MNQENFKIETESLLLFLEDCLSIANMLQKAIQEEMYAKKRKSEKELYKLETNFFYLDSVVFHLNDSIEYISSLELDCFEKQSIKKEEPKNPQIILFPKMKLLD